MTSQELVEKVSSLSPDERTSVARFIDHLRNKSAVSSSAFIKAAEEFMEEHPELLHRLSQ